MRRRGSTNRKFPCPPVMCKLNHAGRFISPPEVLRQHKSNSVCAYRDADSIYMDIYPGIRSLLKVFTQTDLLLAQSPRAEEVGTQPN